MTKTVATRKQSAAKTSAKPAPAQPAQPAQPAPATVALRGGPAVATVRLTGKPYRSAAKHNTDWWTTITAAKGGPVQELIKAGVPSHFIGYIMRRGYLAAE